MKKPRQGKVRKGKDATKGKLQPGATRSQANSGQPRARRDGRTASRAEAGIEWFFQRNDHGQDNGYSDPGVETYKGNIYYYIAREIIQNSIDARNPKSSKPVVVEYESTTVERGKIPDMDALQDAFRRCASFWEIDPKGKAFFEKAARLAAAATISVLKVSDSNTTGVAGGDAERGTDWYNLVRCRGASSKAPDAGGAFGLGKDAPFAASYIRTVLYSTNTGSGQCAFQGVARLATHAPAGGWQGGCGGLPRE
jgi:hypothetical protein